MKSILVVSLEFTDIHESIRRHALARRLDDIAVLIRAGGCDGAVFRSLHNAASGAFLVEHVDETGTVSDE